jgi:hypothetical protein
LFSLDDAESLMKIIVAGWLVLICASLLGQSVPSLFERPGGLVPDEQTAIKIAEAILFPIYGEKTIRSEKPYVVKLKDGKWRIEGSMPQSKSGEIILGGTFHIVISQRDGRVLEIGHDV